MASDLARVALTAMAASIVASSTLAQSGRLAAADGLVQEHGRIGVLTLPSGSVGTFDAADLDGDGRPEIVGVAGGGMGYAAPGSRVWYVMGADDRGGYAVRWVSDVVTWDNRDVGSDGGITALRALDTDGDGRAEVVALSGSGDVRVYDGRAYALLRTASLQRPLSRGTAYPIAWSMAFGDADNDGADDLVVATEASVFLLDPATLRVRLTYNYARGYADRRHAGARDVAVGDVDGDGDQEVVLASGLVLGIRGGAVAIEWDVPPNAYGNATFGHRLRLADVDGDGRDEIAAIGPWIGLRVFDAVHRSVRWEIPDGRVVGGRDFYLGDADADGRVDLVFADSYYDPEVGGTFPMARYTYDPDADAFELVWRLSPLPLEHDNPSGIERGFLVLDFDGDGRPEVFGASSPLQTGPQPMYAVDLATGEVDWRSDHPDGPFYAVSVGDTDGDGNPEIVFAPGSTHAGRGGSQLFVYDAATRREVWRSPEGHFGRRNHGGETVWSGIGGLAVGDVDGDGAAEIVVAADSVRSGALYLFDGRTRALKRIIHLDEDTPLRSVALADLDGDGTPEIVAGSSAATTASPGLFVYAVDGRSGRVLWRAGWARRPYYDPVGYDVAESVAAGDVTGDGTPDVAFVLKPSGVVGVVDGATGVMATAADPMLQGVDLADLDGDGVCEVVVGVLNRIDAPLGTGFVSVYGWRSGALVLLEDHPVQSPVQAVAVADLDGQGRPEVVWSDLYEGPIAYSLDDRRVVWRSGTGLSVSGQPAVADADGDGRTDVVWGAAYAVYHYESTRQATPVTVEDPTLEGAGLAVWPNPSRGPLSLAFRLTGPAASVTIEAVDVLGRVAARSEYGPRAGGDHAETWDPDLAAGTYVLRLSTGGEVQTRPFVRVR